MGFLDNTTNNVILDAVLTDVGRQFLSRNDGSFSIFKFAMGDDEVNYGLITKYGRSIGKEKIQKNTPIFEALTDQSNALKYKLFSVSNPNLIYLPNLNLTTGVTSYTISVNGGKTRETNITVEQDNGADAAQIDPELQDIMFIIEMSDLFLQIPGGGANLQSVDSNQRATYKYTNSTVNSSGGSVITFNISSRALSNQMFTIYGQNNVITTYIRVTGMQSGASLDIPIYITLN